MNGEKHIISRRHMIVRFIFILQQANAHANKNEEVRAYTVFFFLSYNFMQLIFFLCIYTQYMYTYMQHKHSRCQLRYTVHTRIKSKYKDYFSVIYLVQNKYSCCACLVLSSNV